MDVEQIAQVIALSELFYGLGESLPRRFAEVAVVQDMPADTTIIRRDGVTARIGLLLTGKLAYSAHVNGLEGRGPHARPRVMDRAVRAV